MRKVLIIKKENSKYKIPKLLRYRLWNHDIKFEYKGKLYDSEINDNKEIRQISLLVEASNIKRRKERLTFIYDKSCDLLDEIFNEKNLCKFKNNQCFVNRIHGCNVDGCCRFRDNKPACKFLTKHRCTTRNLACKLHVCSYLRKKGYYFKVNDIYMLRYLYSWKQKLFCYFNIFISRKEFLKDIYNNSIILWVFKFRKSGTVLNKNHKENIK